MRAQFGLMILLALSVFVSGRAPVAALGLPAVVIQAMDETGSSPRARLPRPRRPVAVSPSGT